jgi:hypothetical protein
VVEQQSVGPAARAAAGKPTAVLPLSFAAVSPLWSGKPAEATAAQTELLAALFPRDPMPCQPYFAVSRISPQAPQSKE